MIRAGLVATTAVAIAVAAGCTRELREPSSEDESTIYSLVLDSLAAASTGCDTLKPHPLIVLVNRTFRVPLGIRDWQGAPRSLSTAYDSVEHRELPIHGLPKTRWALEVLDSVTLWRLLPPRGKDVWEDPRFYAKYPNACFAAFLSAIALSRSGTWATMGVQAGNFRGGGGGWAVLLRKQGSRWGIQSLEMQQIN
jgi:hypothetical protein